MSFSPLAQALEVEVEAEAEAEILSPARLDSEVITQ